MGSGKGKARRVQVSSSATIGTAAGVGRHYDLWDEFVEGSGLADVRLDQYYLGKEMTDIRSSKKNEEELTKLYTELFADAVSMGVITLPSPYQVEDFKFAIYAGSPPAGLLYSVEFAMKGRHPLNLNDEGDLVHDDLLSSEVIIKKLVHIVHLVEHLVSENGPLSRDQLDAFKW